MNAMRDKTPKPGRLDPPTARGDGTVGEAVAPATLAPPRAAGTAEIL